MGKKFKIFFLLGLLITFQGSQILAEDIKIDNDTFYLSKEMILQAQKNIEKQKEERQSQESIPINLAPEQFKVIKIMEERIWGQTFDTEKPLARIEQLEQVLLFREPQNNPEHIRQRLDDLKLASQRYALKGTSIPSSMRRHYKQEYLQNQDHADYDDVGLIDGLMRAWAPDLYNQFKQVRQAQEASRPGYYYMD